MKVLKILLGVTLVCVYGWCMTNPRSIETSKSKLGFQTNSDVLYKPQAINSKSSIHKVGKVNVLNLYGTREEVAYQHGYFARGIIQNKESALNHYIPLIKNSILNASESSFAGKMYAEYVDSILLDEYINNAIPSRDQGVYGALASGAGIHDADDVYRALLFPDMGQYLLGKNSGDNDDYDFIKHLPGYGCTSIISESKSNPGTVLMGRNFDFSSYGAYEKNASIVIIHPSEPEDQKYMMFTSLGLHSAHTTWNESGIFLSLHQLMVNDNKSSGTYILGITDEISRRAHNLDEAKKIIDSHSITSSWRIILHSTKEHKTLLADVSASKKSFQLLEDKIHFFTNHLMSKDLIENQFFPYYNYGRDSLQRYNYLTAKTKFSDNLTLQQIVDLLSSKERVLSDNKTIVYSHSGVVSKASNLMSVVIDPGGQSIYFAVPHNFFEASPSGIYQKIPLSFNADWSGIASTRASQSDIVPSHKYTRSYIDTEANLRRAESKYEQRGTLEEIFPYIIRAHQYSPKDVYIALLKSGMELKLFAKDNEKKHLLASAISTLESAKSIAHESEEKYPLNLIDLILARAYVMNGNITGAQNILQNWGASSTSYIHDNVKKDLDLIIANKNDLRFLKEQFNDSLLRLTFEITDTDVSTL